MPYFQSFGIIPTKVFGKTTHLSGTLPVVAFNGFLEKACNVERRTVFVFLNLVLDSDFGWSPLRP
jgi:hypothetical protein